MSVIAPSTPASAGAPSRLTNPAIPHICEGQLRLKGRSSLLGSESPHRIDAGGSGRRQAAGYQGGSRQTNSDQGDSWRIVWLDSIEHAAHDATNTKRGQYAHSD